MRIWFLTGSQGLYGEDVLDQVRRQSQEIARQLDEAAAVPAEVVWKPVLTDAGAIRRVCLDANADDDCLGVITWMHRFSPAKMWISDWTRCASRCCTCTPRPTSRCPGPRSTWNS